MAKKENMVFGLHRRYCDDGWKHNGTRRDDQTARKVPGKIEVNTYHGKVKDRRIQKRLQKREKRSK